MSANDIFVEPDIEKAQEYDEWKRSNEDWRQSEKGTHRCPDGTIISVHRKEFTNACILEVIAGTNGYHGGDAGHGSRTFIRVRDLADTCMRVRRIVDKWDSEGFSVELAGDCELQNLIWGLQFILNVLRDQSKEEG